MLNKILMSPDPVIHAGRFASLANAWTNVNRVFLEETKIADAKKQLAEMKMQLEERWQL